MTRSNSSSRRPLAAVAAAALCLVMGAFAAGAASQAPASDPVPAPATQAAPAPASAPVPAPLADQAPAPRLPVPPIGEDSPLALRPWLGVELQDLDDALRAAFDFKRSGVLVSHVAPESPAARAGLERGDIIVSAGGKAVERSDDIISKVRAASPGDRLLLRRMRAGKEKAVEVTLGTAPARSRVRARALTGRRQGHLGARVEPMREGLSGYFGVEAGAGVLVLEVSAGSPAAQAGLEAGDVIVKLAGEPVTTTPAFARDIRRREPGSDVQLEVVRKGKRQVMTATLGELEVGNRLRQAVRMAPDDLGPLMENLRERMADGREALSARVEQLEKELSELKSKIEELRERR